MEVASRMSRRRLINLVGAGTYGRLLLPKLRAACDELGGTPSLLTQGVLEFNLATNGEPTNFGGGGVRDVSPSPSEIHNAIGNAGSEEVAESNRVYWQRPVAATVDRVVQAHLEAGITDGLTLWCQGLKTGHSLPAVEALRSLKQKMPKQFIVGNSVIPDDWDKRQQLKVGHDLFVSLKDEGVVEATFLSDNLGPLALSFTLDVQDRFVAKALASLITGQLQFSKNPSLGEVGRSLGEYGAFVGVACRSPTIVVAKTTPGWRALGGVFGLPERGSTPIDNLIIEAQTATRIVLTDRDALTIDEPIDLRKPFTLVYTVPLKLSNVPAWHRFSNQLRAWLARIYPRATPIFACGNGTPDPRYSGSYWLQVSALYPLPDIPAPIREILNSESLRRKPPQSAGGRQTSFTVVPIAEREELAG
jgi:hypothetical protein